MYGIPWIWIFRFLIKYTSLVVVTFTIIRLYGVGNWQLFNPSFLKSYLIMIHWFQHHILAKYFLWCIFSPIWTWMIAMWGPIVTKIIVGLDAKKNWLSMEKVWNLCIFFQVWCKMERLSQHQCAFVPKVNCQSFGVSHFILPFSFPWQVIW